MIIRKAIHADLEQLLELNKEVQDIHVNAYPKIFKTPNREEVNKWLLEQLTNDANIFNVSIIDDIIVGYILIKKINRQSNPFMHPQKYGLIDQICINAGFRHRGIGKSLILDGIELLRISGYERVDLDVWEKNNLGNIAFSGIGFNPIRHIMTYGALD